MKTHPIVIWCNWSPVREVCPNYVVVVFQPWTVTPPHRGFVAYRYTLDIGLPTHLFLLFSISFFSLLLPTASPSIVFPCQVYLLIFTRFRTTLLVQSATHLDVVCTCHPPASVACPWVPLYVPASAAVSCDSNLPIFFPCPAPRSLLDPGGFTHPRSLRVFVYLHHSPWVLLQILASHILLLNCFCSIQSRWINIIRST